MAAVYAEHFTPFNVAAISLWPGFVATERMTQLMETDPGVKQLKEKMGFESTELSGRVIRALDDDPNLLTLSGKRSSPPSEAGLGAIASTPPVPETPACRSCHTDRSDYVHRVPRRLSVRVW